ncbi:sigma-70 family RNA polymerase sigma factor [Desulfurispirillum indicum]|uniref:sigma-70 family RNA polymerase sigma factor n=1 Tax=Desulfurispirillum indicum TaxID=936456 RepID=UPI001CFBF7E4|nr:sigma-70 family RNA polymerase sigma factor [Desulfurispirillum indicum]UCZ56859.1 sigma-70 family RNA polymerase sigma factor [Desulfurispirillum indicum]
MTDDLDDLPTFEAELEPAEFTSQHLRETASEVFTADINFAAVFPYDEDKDWDLDHITAPISGEGIGSVASVVSEHSTEYDFLKVRNRGRQSTKHATVQTGTQLSIDPDTCINWTSAILTKGYCSIDDIELLIALCEGNGDPGDLCINLQNILEAAGFDSLHDTFIHNTEFREAKLEVLSEDLAEAIEAALTRATQLPGTHRFTMDKSYELQLLKPLIHAKQELQLGILSSEVAINAIINAANNIRIGLRNPASVSLKTIFPLRPSHPETAEFMASVEVMNSWLTDGRIMDGKQRREALAALESLDLSLSFHKELVHILEQEPAHQKHADLFNAQILAFEDATEHLIQVHLPYVRRFAARNVEEGEDPEDIFQVAFMGLHRSIRRFNPELGNRFLVYATHWMWQAVMRWRADEGAMIRIPVHRNAKINELDRVLNRTTFCIDGPASDEKLATELGWPADEVRQFRNIPREAVYPESCDDWDALLPAPEEMNAFDRAETELIVKDILAELRGREADVIRMRFGIGYDSEMTLEEIGTIYGITRERVRQIETKGFKCLNHPGRKLRLQILLGMK